MAYARVRNATGRFVKADLSSVTAAAVVPIPDDFRLSLTNSPAADAYPISSFTWLLVRARYDDQRKRQALTTFLHWMLTSGQRWLQGWASHRYRRQWLRRRRMRYCKSTDVSKSTGSPRRVRISRRLRDGNRIASCITLLAAATVLLITFLLFIELLRQSALPRQKFGFAFLFSHEWDPVAGRFGLCRSYTAR
jgi:hypothetical protein